MTNAHEMKPPSPRSEPPLCEHAKAISVGVATLASDLFETMVRDARSLQLQTASVTATNVVRAVAATGAGR